MYTVFTWLNAAPSIVVALGVVPQSILKIRASTSFSRASRGGQIRIVPASILLTKVIKAAAFNQVHTVISVNHVL